MRGKAVPRTPSRFSLDVPAELLEEREELARQAPALDKTVAGALGSSPRSSAPGDGELAFIPRRR